MRVTIRGKKYEILFLDEVVHPDGEVLLGSCDPPQNKSPRRILIDKNLKERKMLEIICHEVLHGAFWDLGEPAIEESARDLAEILFKLGYRKT